MFWCLTAVWDHCWLTEQGVLLSVLVPTADWEHCWLTEQGVPLSVLVPTADWEHCWLTERTDCSSGISVSINLLQTDITILLRLDPPPNLFSCYHYPNVSFYSLILRQFLFYFNGSFQQRIFNRRKNWSTVRKSKLL